MTIRDKANDVGFTLIESMVALIILGIAAVGIIRAVEAHIDQLHQLDQRAAAQWVAENALAEARLGTRAQDPTATAMLEWTWSVQTRLTKSQDPDLMLATVEVSPQGSNASMVTLTGFVDRGSITP